MVMAMAAWALPVLRTSARSSGAAAAVSDEK